MLTTIRMLLLASLSIGACQTDDSSVSTAQEYWDSSTINGCEHIFDCCSATEIRDYGVRTESTCVSDLNTVLKDYYGAIQREIEAGVTIFHADHASQCLNARIADSCPTGKNPAAQNCQRIFEGTVANGEGCFNRVACVSDLCVGLDFDNPAQEGICTARPRLNEACTYNSCAADLHCDMASTGNGICIEQLPNGEPCNSSPECTNACVDSGTSAGKVCGFSQFCDGL